MLNISVCLHRIRSITGLRYTLQTGLDSLETSRRKVLERLLEIDQTMGIPKQDDIERVRFCPNCQSGDGPLCIHCELDSLFQVQHNSYTVYSS